MRKVAVVSICFGLLFIAACGSNDEGEEKLQEHEEMEKQPDDEKQPEEEVVYTETEPLTGVGVEEVSPYRPMAVMVNNHPAARPQSGVSQADIVYEVLTEGDITRWLAIFKSNPPEEIGPIRSARPYFIDLADGYDALFVTHGWSPAAERQLRSSATPYLNGLTYDGTIFQRNPERRAPHNSYVTYERVLEGFRQASVEVEREVSANHFEEERVSYEDDILSSEVTVHYRNPYTVQYIYNEEMDAYERFSNGEPTIDFANQERISLQNVFIIEAPHRVVDDEGRRQIYFNDGGQGILLQNGKALRVEWMNEQGRIVPMKDGSVVPFLPGQTWINVIPSSPGIAQYVSGLENSEMSSEEGNGY